VTGKRSLAVLAALGVLAAVAIAFRPAAVPVEVGSVARGDLRVTVEEEGKTRIRDRFVVSAPATGRLLRVQLKEGDAVRDGDVVARLEPLPLDERTRAEARARLKAAEAAQSAAEARVRQTGTSLEQARRGHERADRLAGEGLRSPEDREQAELAEASLARELDAARFSARAAAFAAEAARATLVADQPGRAEGNVIALKSPVTGRVLRVLQESERSILAGSPVLEVGEPGNLEIVVDLLSTDAVRVKPGAPMELDGGEGRKLRARVRIVEPAAFTKISALGVEEQRVNVIGDLQEPPGRLGDAYRVEASITLWEGKGIVKVPASALFRRGQGWSVFVAQDARARLRSVEIGQRNPAEAQVLGGLKEGEKVVLHPSDRIEDGVRIRPAG
ncbi:MAG: efflux RND transporter periplasmic adaptor subunit, partial [Syntrophomonadaceae bacterium]